MAKCWHNPQYITRCPNAADTSVLSSFLYYRGGWGQPGDRAWGQRWAQAGSSAGGSSSSESNSAFSSFTHLPEGSWIQPALERDGQMDRGREQRLILGLPAPGGWAYSPPQLQVSLQHPAPLGAEPFGPAQSHRFSLAASLRPCRSCLWCVWGDRERLV